MNEPADSNDAANECVHSHPIPASELSEYRVDADPHSEQDIARYVEIEAREKVQHVEKIKQEVVLAALSVKT